MDVREFVYTGLERERVLLVMARAFAGLGNEKK